MTNKGQCSSATVMISGSNSQTAEKSNIKGYLSLNELNLKEKAKIISLPEHSLLAPLGIREGKEIKLKSKQPIGGPLIIKVKGRTVALSRNISKKIKIKELV